MSLALIEAKNLGYSYSKDLLFSNVSFALHKGDRVALIGSNGSGKTTLLKLLAKELEADVGDVVYSGKVFYVPQIDTLQDRTGGVIDDFVKTYLGRSFASIRQHTLLTDSTVNSESLISSLSSGEYLRLYLATAFSSDCNILLLDEPTNHLDYASVNKLISLCKSYSGVVIFVSHHRDFLISTSTRILELSNSSVQLYSTSYSEYVKIVSDKQEALLRKRTALQKKEVQLAEAITEKMNKSQSNQVKAQKKLRMNDRSETRMAINTKRNWAQNSIAKAIRSFASRKGGLNEEISELETMLVAKKVTKPKIVSNTSSGTTLIRVEDGALLLSKRVLLKGVTLDIRTGDRIGLVGANGAGKSLLVKTIFSEGEIKAELTNVLYKRDLVISAYVSQHYSNIQLQDSVIDNIKAHCNYEYAYEHARSFGFNEMNFNALANTLSGGQKARLSIACATAQPLDILILDEPTNNIDMDSAEIISTALLQFTGALVTISHDLEFMKSIKTAHICELKNSSCRLLY
jgi:ATPase subunit of ABC transporter with duplicated ATPase domains